MLEEGRTMLAVEIIGGVIVAAILFVSTWMAIVGLLGVTGSVRMRRCRDCGHLAISWPGHAMCLFCRHPWMVHHVAMLDVRHRLPGEL
jgi:hypothetical protein